MKKPAIFLSALLLVLTLSGFQNENKYQQHRPYQPDWNNQGYYNCRDTTDCVALQTPCGGLRAFARQYSGIVARWYEYEKSWSGCQGSPNNLDMSPVCSTAKKCVMAKPGAFVPKKDDPAYCDLPEDCAIVAGKCGKPTAVNVNNAAAVAADPSTFSSCARIDDRVTGPVSCEEHLCKIQLYKKEYAPAGAFSPLDSLQDSGSGAEVPPEE